MKFIIHLLLLSLPLFANAQLQGIWVAVDSRPASTYTGFISPLDGAIFHFTSRELRIGNVFSDTIMIFKYEWKNSKVILNDSTSAVIRHLSRDSLLLEFDKQMVTLFYPLEDDVSPVPALTDDLLITNTWMLAFGDYQEEWYFTDVYSNMFPGDESKIAVIRFDATEFWNTTVYQDHVLLTLTQGQHDRFIYQVLGVQYDTIRLRPLNGWNKDIVDFIKSPMVPDQLVRTRAMLTNVWNTVDIVETDSSEFYGFYRPWFDTLLISQQQFYDKLIVYKFNNDGSYCIMLAEEEYVCGTWELLEDGRTIRVDEGIDPDQYLEILELDDHQLVISNRSKFSIEPGSNHWVEIEYIIKLE